MNTITLRQPPRVVFGNGCAIQSAEFLAQRGAKRILLVTSKSVRPQIEFLVAEIKKFGAEIFEGRFIPAEPTLNFFETALVEICAQKIDAVLAVGGGSVIDVAKLFAAFADSPQKIQDVFGINLLAARKITLVSLPTTAGTGSEVSPIAVLLDEAAELKKGVVSPHLVPDAAFVDPLLTISVPPEITAATGLDALTHCIEAYANKFAHPVTDNYALRGIELISKNLLAAVRDGKNLEARSALALGSFYGGLCLGPVNTAAIHALSYPLGGKFRIAHGVANALLLPANPTLGRTIRHGEYFLRGRPLHKTEFAHDPHFPRRSSQVLRLVKVRNFFRCAWQTATARSRMEQFWSATWNPRRTWKTGLQVATSKCCPPVARNFSTCC